MKTDFRRKKGNLAWCIHKEIKKRKRKERKKMKKEGRKEG